MSERSESNGGGGNRTGSISNRKNANLKTGGTKSGTVRVSLTEIVQLAKAWSMLPQAAREATLMTLDDQARGALMMMVEKS